MESKPIYGELSRTSLRSSILKAVGCSLVRSEETYLLPPSKQTIHAFVACSNIMGMDPLLLRLHHEEGEGDGYYGFMLAFPPLPEEKRERIVPFTRLEPGAGVPRVATIGSTAFKTWMSKYAHSKDILDSLLDADDWKNYLWHTVEEFCD